MIQTKNTIDVSHLSRHYLATHLRITNHFKLPVSADVVESHLTAACQAQIAAARGGIFGALSEGMQKAISEISEYMTTASPSNGLLIMGSVGTGKTTLAKALGSVVWQLSREGKLPPAIGIGFASASRIVQTATDEAATYKTYAKTDRLTVDDIGTEPTIVTMYGSKMQPMVDLLIQRYEQRAFTVLTTNCTAAELQNVYGIRVRDRLREWLHPVILSGDSMR